jgi:hypothetical protein
MTGRRDWEVRFRSGTVERLEPDAPLTPEQERALGSGGAELVRLDELGTPDIIYATVAVYGEPEAPHDRVADEATGGTPLRAILIERSGSSAFRVGERFGTLAAFDATLAAARRSLAGAVDQGLGLLLMWRDGTAARCNLSMFRNRNAYLADQVIWACGEVLADGRFGVIHALVAITRENALAASAAEARSRARRRTRLEDASKAEYSEPDVRPTFRYITQGVLRGRCGHQHKSLEGATRCLMKDEIWCRAQGGGGDSDRRIFVVGGGTKRELNEAELAAVEAFRPAIAKELAEPPEPR